MRGEDLRAGAALAHLEGLGDHRAGGVDEDTSALGVGLGQAVGTGGEVGRADEVGEIVRGERGGDGGEEEGASEEVSAMAGAIVRRRREEASRRREARIIALGTAAGARVRARPRRAAGVAAARIAKRSLPSETRGVSGLGRLLARRRGVDASCGARQALAAGSIPNSLTRVVFVHAGVPMG